MVSPAPTDGETPLLAAAFNGHDAVVARLLAVAGVDVNQARTDGVTTSGATPLCIAAQEGHDAVVARLLAVAGVDVNMAFRCTTPLQV